MLSLALLILGSSPALALADPTYTPAVVQPTPAVEPAMPAVKPIRPTPAPAVPEVPRVTATAPAVYWMYSNRNRTWYTHHDKAWLETYVRSLDAPPMRVATYQTACPGGVCPR